jgi:hypothetical protein
VNRIGEMNGKWAFLFKVSMALMPIACAAQGWILNRLYQMDQRMAGLQERIAVVESNHWMTDQLNHQQQQIDRIIEKLLNDR